MLKKQITLLVIEDCETDRELYQRLLRKDQAHSYTLIETTSKQEALKHFQEKKPDCLLLDYNLPGFNGVDFLKELMARYPDEAVACVLLTAGGSEELAVKAMKAGARDYLPKDQINNESLRRVIHNAIEKASLEREVKQKHANLEDALQEAKAANSAKSEFLANMSHEIRTPLNGIIGFIDLLAEQVKEEEQEEFLELARCSADHLLALINDILDFPKIEAGRIELEQVPFNLRDAIQLALNICRPQIESKQLEAVISISEEVPQFVVGDCSRFQQVLVNLIGNAAKFTTQGGGICLLLEVQSLKNDKVELHVGLSDSGIGIPQQQQEKIFESFSQVDSSTTRKYGGTGLGLSIAAKLVGLMQGDIWVDSREDLGSTFHFTAWFGLSDQVEQSCGSSESRDMSLGKDPAHSAPLSLLVAEDNLVNQKLIKAILERKGHTVTLANDGAELLSILNSQSGFDLILMDIQMPGVDGVEATRKIREEEAKSGAHIPIVGLSAHALVGDSEKYLACGMDAYVTKPIQRKELFQVIENLSKGQEFKPDN